MPDALGKIEKPSVEEFQKGRKLFFVPLVLTNPGLPAEFTEKNSRYWEQVELQIANLEAKLGAANRIYHELVPESGEEGLKTLKQLNMSSLPLIQSRTVRGAVLEAAEDTEILTELMDWSRCLSIGLQSQKVYSTIYNFYIEANQKRNEAIAQKINDTLKENEICIVFMAENHQVRFPEDINIFYVAPPALDELKRWMRDYETRLREVKESEETETQPGEQGNSETNQEK